jgi:hypothetical protein
MDPAQPSEYNPTTASENHGKYPTQLRRIQASATCHFASPLFDFLSSFGERLKAEKLKSILHNNKGTYNQHTLVGELSKKRSCLYK